MLQCSSPKQPYLSVYLSVCLSVHHKTPPYEALLGAFHDRTWVRDTTSMSPFRPFPSSSTTSSTRSCMYVIVKVTQACMGDDMCSSHTNMCTSTGDLPQNQAALPALPPGFSSVCSERSKTPLRPHPSCCEYPSSLATPSDLDTQLALPAPHQTRT